MTPALLTAGNHRLVFWGTADHLRHCAIPSCFNEDNQTFEFPLLPFVVSHLKEVVPGLTIDQRLVDYMTELNSRLSQFDNLKQQDNIHEVHEVGLNNLTLLPHQNVASKINELFPRILCLDEMGLGKTVVSLRTALYRKYFSNNKRCLIICPNSIKLTVWAKEIKKFTGLGFCVPTGTSKRREKLIRQFLELNKSNTDYYFLIINFKMTTKFLELFKEYVDGQLLIIDEAHYMKNKDSQRTEAIYKLNPKYVLALTGTPFHNQLEDVFSLAEYICPLIFGGSFTRFKDDYCIEAPIKMEVKTKDDKVKTITKNVITKYKNIEQLKQKLALISYRRTKKDVLTLPEKTYENRLVKMTTEQWKHYEKMRKECYVLITQSNEEEIESTANGILAKLLRLSQITDGYVTDFADKSRAYWIEKNGKLAELDDLLTDIVKRGGNKVVVWSRFVEVVKYLAARYKDSYGAVFITGEVPTDERAEIVDTFQTNPQVKVFVGQIQSCGVGMTLHAASYEVFYDKCFIPSSVVIQAEDRCHRIGMGDRCTIISLIAKGSIDEHWEETLNTKLSMADAVLADDKALQRSKAEDVLPDQLSKESILSLLKVGKKGD